MFEVMMKCISKFLISSEVQIANISNLQQMDETRLISNDKVNICSIVGIANFSVGMKKNLWT